MSLKHSYSLLAPLYDFMVGQATLPIRHQSLLRMGDVSGKTILLTGIGTGLDIPHLPDGAHYVGIDLTTAMLKRARTLSGQRRNIVLQQGDVMHMPYQNASFDIVIMHLILAVVPQPLLALQEASRVLRPSGRILILDKFLRPGQWAPIRRLLNLFTRHVATRTDVVIEPLLTRCPELELVHDNPALAGGWFRHIELQKKQSV